MGRGRTALAVALSAAFGLLTFGQAVLHATSGSSLQASAAGAGQVGGTATSLSAVRTGPRWIVRMHAGSATAAAVRSAASRQGATVIASQPTLCTLVLDADPMVAAAISHLPGVRAVVPDSQVSTVSLGSDHAGQPGAVTSVIR